MPIPPYIRGGHADAQDREDYQTVYAKEAGSVAAPTAGLHFDKKLLVQLENSGHTLSYTSLHVGLGTFAPVKANNLKEYEDFYLNPVKFRPKGAEPLDYFIKRVTFTYDKVIKEHQGEHILIIAHAGVNRAIIANALDISPIGLYRIHVKNAGISRIKNNHLGNHLLYHNIQLAHNIELI